MRARGGIGRRGVVVAGAVALGLVGAAAGCGGDRQDADEPSGTYTIEVTRATFPTDQRLAEQAKLAISVRNSGNKEVPNVAVTVQPGAAANGTTAQAQAFAEASDQPGLADPSRPVWVLNEGPHGGTTAYVNTWSLGKLAPGATKTFIWDVTAVKSGTHSIRYRVAGGLDGKAKAQLSTGQPAEGEFTVKISAKPADARVGPNGEVIVIPQK